MTQADAILENASATQQQIDEAVNKLDMAMETSNRRKFRNRPYHRLLLPMLKQPVAPGYCMGI
ncbi:MAG: hypothetical protein HC905_02300 [Bacteroidales bacterium]|nr:hypothetical protein [Bacteroidales bacterium]